MVRKYPILKNKKYCTHKDCTEINPQILDNFNKHKLSLDGLGSNCRSCQRRLNKESTKKWKKNNPDKNAALAAKYHAARLKRMPKWLSNEQLKEIYEFYTISTELSWLSEGGLRVDHIIPLRGVNVSGLHVPWNLRVIPTYDNLTKYNKVF